MKLTPLDAPGYEKVVYAEDEASGLKSIIAVHNTKLGPAAGGCRMFAYLIWRRRKSTRCGFPKA